MTAKPPKYVAVTPPHLERVPDIARALQRTADDLCAAWPLEQTRSAALLRPFLTLDGPGRAIHCEALLRSYHEVAEGGTRMTTFQNNTPANFRRILGREIVQAEAPDADPADVPAGKRSPSWRDFLALLDVFDDLDGWRKLGVVRLLNRLGYYRATLARLDRKAIDERETPEIRSALLGSLAIATLKCGQGDTAAADLLCEASAAAEKDAEKRAAFEIYLTVHYGKQGDAPAALDWHSKRALASYREHVGVEGPEDPLFRSIFLRGLAYVPFNKRQFDEATAVLDDAERAAYGALTDRAVDPLAARENLFAILETRIKEALGTKDIEIALSRAERLVALDPDDPRPHLHLGEVYLAASDLEKARAAFHEAALVGAPYTARSLFMLGATLQRLGRTDEAMAAHCAAVRIEPGAVSALLELRSLARATDRWDLVRLCETQIVALRAEVAGKEVA